MMQLDILFTALAVLGGDSAFEHPFETDTSRIPSIYTGGDCLVRGATIHSAVGEPFVGDVLVRDGDIAEIGEDLAAPDGFEVIDAEGFHLAPGVVDTHSHMAIAGPVNEGTLSITAECDITDVVDAEDVGLYRALAGGTTTLQLLHGSANAIGGRSEVIKARWKEDADALRFEGAPQGIKFALGENPKRANWGERGARFPDTRMGVEAIFHRAFTRALEYTAEWEAYEEAAARAENALPPRRDIRLEVLAGILEGDVTVHSHCYRADEILMLIRTADHFGFQLGTLQHVLEGYKVAPEMAEHGVGGSTFSDWWGYKIEAYDAIPHNAALMEEAGVVASINSDSGELVRHLYQEAAKSVRYADMDRVAALALVTINPARQLGIGDRVGSIEVGKDADLVLLNGDPLSFMSRVEWTMVDGEVEFQRTDAFDFENDPAPLTELTEEVDAASGGGSGDAYAIVGGTIHPITGPVIENGTLLMRGGRIVAMGEGIELPSDARVTDATGQHVWPGMIALDTGLGIREIDSVRGTDDLSEIGGNQPDIRVTASIHPDSAHIPVTRTDGVTRAQVAPQGGGPLMGQSSVIRLDGFTWEELLVKDRDMLHVRFPRVGNTAEDKSKPDAVEELSELLEEAREYGRLEREAAETGSTPPSLDPRLAALVPYATGEARVALHADNAQTILYALEFAAAEELDAVLYGVREGWKVVDAIAASGLPVVVGPVLSVPRSEYDPYDSAYANAAVLHRAGVPFAIMSNDTENERTLVYHAATAAGFGLPVEEAVRAVTYYPARILGIEDQVGSLQPGKVGDVVVTDGHLLDVTSRPEHLFIEGVPVPVTNRQTELYERYRARILSMR